MGEVHEWIDGSTVGGSSATHPASFSRAPTNRAPTNRPPIEWAPPLALVVGLGLAALSAGHVRHLVWIGRPCWPCPLLFDAHPRMAQASTLIDTPDDRARVWTMDVVLRCSAHLAVIADGRGLTLAHTRRLQLAAGAGGGLCLLLRPGGDESHLSAASTRWVISCCPSASERPRWSAAAIRNKHCPALECRAMVEWDDASGLVSPSPGLARRASLEAAAS